MYWILDLEDESALNMGYMDKEPSRMKGQIFFKVGWGGQHFSVIF